MLSSSYRSASRQFISIIIAIACIVTPVAFRPVTTVQAFMPYNSFALAVALGSSSHETITREVIAQFDRGLFSVPEPTQAMNKAIDEIVNYNGRTDTDELFFSLSALHVDGENFNAAQRRLIGLKLGVRDFLSINDVGNARSVLGGALHTLQDFYSHSNWVELGNNVVHPDLGVVGKTLNNPSRTLATCTDCARNVCADCVDANQILPLTTNQLTSGYYLSSNPKRIPEDRKKPHDLKCSHGGRVTFSVFVDERDASGKGDLSNGINKDTNKCEISPHRNHHREAARLAKLATQKYLNEIQALIGLPKMRLLLGGSPTVAFVVDTTGSMFDEISRVRQQILQIIDFRLSINLPTRYILMPFNDPQVGPFTITDDPNVFRNAVNALTASGGGDCPELSQTAMYRTLDLMDSGGSIMMFTDADARDSQLARSVSSLARRKNIGVYNIFSGGDGCGDGLGYFNTASESGGQLFFVGPTEVGPTAQLMNFLGMPNTVNILSRIGTISGVAQTFPIRVDSTLTRTTLTVTGTGATNIVVRRPDGSVVDSTDPTATFIPLSTGLILSLTTPVPGIWSVTLNPGSPPAAAQSGGGTKSSHNQNQGSSSNQSATALTSSSDFSINVTGESSLNLESFNFTDLSGGGFHQGFSSIPGYPVAGQQRKVIMNVVSQGAGTISAELRKLDGTVLQTLTMEEIPIAPNDDPEFRANLVRQFQADITVPTTPFQVYITGLDSSGRPFERLLPGIVKPQTVQITPTSFHGLHAGQEATFTLDVKNVGAADTFEFDGVDSQSYIRSISPATFTLNTNETKEIRVQVQPPANVAFGTSDTFTFSAQSVTNADLNNRAVVGPLMVSEEPTLKVGTVSVTAIGGNGDGFIDPGEGASVSVQLTNTGTSTAANITATLATRTPGITVVQNESAYANLSPAASGTNIAPFHFYASRNAACGRLIDFVLIVSIQDDAGLNANTFVYDFSSQMGRIDTASLTANYTGPPVPIPDPAVDPNPVNIPISVSGLSGSVSDLNFRFNGTSCTTAIGATTVGLDHSFVSDLDIKLISPQGTVVTLMSGAGESGNNFCNTLLDDEGGGVSIQETTAANAPFSGTFRPAEPLAKFRGENPNGTWTLRVTDTFTADTGNVRAFSLAIATAQPHCDPVPPTNPGDVVISEFRLRGQSGAGDEFIELHNKTNGPIGVSAVDQSNGWALVAADGGVRFTIPNETIIPARGHYLAVNSSTYSLSGYASGDVSFTNDIADNSGIALFRTAQPSNFNLANRLDAVGFSPANSLYREGAGLAPIGSNNGQISFVRKMTRATIGVPQDTGDNSADFVFVSTSAATFGTIVSELGPPAPENFVGPIERNSTIPMFLLDGAVSATSPPNRVRDFTPVTNGDLGTLSIRRTVRNDSGRPVKQLRFRVVETTTLNSPIFFSGQADIRALSSSDVTVTLSSGQQVLVKGTSLEGPPTQPLGGGLNSAYTVQLPLGGLAPGASINVILLVGIMRSGTFKLFVNVEALH